MTDFLLSIIVFFCFAAVVVIPAFYFVFRIEIETGYQEFKRRNVNFTNDPTLVIQAQLESLVKLLAEVNAMTYVSDSFASTAPQQYRKTSMEIYAPFIDKKTTDEGLSFRPANIGSSLRIAGGGEVCV